MARKIDVGTWLNTEQVAQQLKVRPRTVVDWVVKGRLHPQKYQRPGKKGATISLYDPEEVELIAQQRMADNTEVLPASAAGLLPIGNNLVRPAIAEQLAAILHPPMPLGGKLYMTLSEASVYTGLGKSYIATHAKGVKAGPRGAVVFRRSDLDQL